MREARARAESDIAGQYTRWRKIGEINRTGLTGGTGDRDAEVTGGGRVIGCRLVADIGRLESNRDGSAIGCREHNALAIGEPILGDNTRLRRHLVDRVDGGCDVGGHAARFIG